MKYLVAVGKTTHTTHNAEDVVVNGIDVEVHVLVLCVEDRFSTVFKLKNGIVNAGKVTGSAGLVFFRGKSKGVGVDVLLAGIITTIYFTTNTGNTAVVFVVLDFAEIVGITDRKSVVTVKLKKSRGKRINIIRCGSATSIVKPSVTSGKTGSGIGGVSVNPDKFFNGVIKVKGDVFGGGVNGNRFSTSKLNLFNKVFVADLGKTTTFIGIKVDVVNIEFATKSG